MTRTRAMSRSALHLNAAIVGTIALVFFWLRELFAIGPALGLAVTLIFIGSVLAVFFTRRADEYVAALWRCGANAAFLMILFWFVAAPAAEGFYDGLTGAESKMDLPQDLGSILALTAFFVAHAWARIRGTY